MGTYGTFSLRGGYRRDHGDPLQRGGGVYQYHVGEDD